MGGRPLRLTWHEDQDHLREQYRSERDPELRTRWHGLWLVRQGHSLTDAATLVGVNARTVRQWIAWYQDGGLAEVARHRHGGRQGRMGRLTPAEQQALIKETERGALLSSGDAVAWVEQQFGKRYRSFGMRSLLHRLGLRKKVPRPLAEKAELAAQAAWKKGGSARR